MNLINRIRANGNRTVHEHIKGKRKWFSQETPVANHMEEYINRNLTAFNYRSKYPYLDYDNINHEKEIKALIEDQIGLTLKQITQRED